jgi:hypothetical protein
MKSRYPSLRTADELPGKQPWVVVEPITGR